MVPLQRMAPSRTRGRNLFIFVYSVFHFFGESPEHYLECDLVTIIYKKVRV